MWPQGLNILTSIASFLSVTRLLLIAFHLVKIIDIYLTTLSIIPPGIVVYKA
jgi:hypothetical protein